MSGYYVALSLVSRTRPPPSTALDVLYHQSGHSGISLISRPSQLFNVSCRKTGARVCSNIEKLGGPGDEANVRLSGIVFEINVGM